MTDRETAETGHDRPAGVPGARLQDALEAIGAGAYLVDEQGRIVAANSLAERLLDRPAEDMIGRDAHELLHRGPQGQPLPATQCCMRQAFHAGHPAQAAEDYFARADGSVLRISWLIAPTPWTARSPAHS